MSDQVINNKSDSAAEQALNKLKENGNFDISPYDDVINIDDNPKFKKLELSSAQKMQMSALASQLPTIMALDGMAALSSIPNLYTLTFPEGLPHTLMRLNQGGFGTVLRGADGKFVGTASLYPADIASQLSTQAMVLGTFSAMSVVSGQYFLAQINSELNRLKLGMDKILDFLYGDKKAELMSEVNFAKYAYQNYSAIMAQEGQRVATITGLQQARKIAMKDSEFYIVDLESTINEKSDIISVVNKALQIKESLELALQLCVMSSILEVYYSQNFDSDYLKYIEQDISLYIDKCEKVILGNFNKLQVLIDNASNGVLKKVNKGKLQKSVDDVLNEYTTGSESELKKSLHSGLHMSDKQLSYYLSKDGNVYVKTA